MHYVIMLMLVMNNGSVELHYSEVRELYCKQQQEDAKGTTTIVRCIEKSGDI